MGGLAAPCLNRGQLFIIPAKKENLTTRVGEDCFTLQWVCGGPVYPEAFEHSGLGRLLAEMLRPGCPRWSDSIMISLEESNSVKYLDQSHLRRHSYHPGHSHVEEPESANFHARISS